MSTPTLSKRLAVLETAHTAAPARLTPEKIEGAARLYEASLYHVEPNPRAEAYWRSVSPQQLFADYTAMLNGGPAPW